LLRYDWEFMTIFLPSFSCVCKNWIVTFLMRWKCALSKAPLRYILFPLLLFASGYSKQERCFWQDGQIDQYASWTWSLKILAFSLSCITKKNQAVILLISVLYAYIHCFCAELAIYRVLHGASKNFTLSFMVQVKQLGARP